MTWVPVSEWEEAFVWFPRFDHNGTLLWGKVERQKVKLHSDLEYDGTRYRYRRWFANKEVLGGDAYKEADKLDDEDRIRQEVMLECLDIANAAAKGFDDLTSMFDKQGSPTNALIAKSKAFGAGMVASDIEVAFIKRWPDKRMFLVTRSVEKAEQALVDGINRMAKIRGIK